MQSHSATTISITNKLFRIFEFFSVFRIFEFFWNFGFLCLSRDASFLLVVGDDLSKLVDEVELKKIKNKQIWKSRALVFVSFIWFEVEPSLIQSLELNWKKSKSKKFKKNRALVLFLLWSWLDDKFHVHPYLRSWIL